MVNLHQQLGGFRISVLLVDMQGQILDMIGDERGQPATSECWPLSSASRTGQLHGSLVRKHAGRDIDRGSLFGIATPINAASGGVIGIVDRSASPRRGMQHISAMLQLTAETIERRIVDQDARGFLLLRFHTRIETLEGPSDAIALFDRDSRLIAYNKLAANLLSLSRNGLNTRCQDCLEAQWTGLVGSAAFAKTSPIQLRTRTGTSLFAYARLR